MTAKPRPALHVGSHVEIKSGMWRGFRGQIVAPFTEAGLQWVVELRTGDAMNGHRTAQATRNLRKAAADG